MDTANAAPSLSLTPVDFHAACVEDSPEKVLAILAIHPHWVNQKFPPSVHGGDGREFRSPMEVVFHAGAWRSAHALLTHPRLSLGHGNTAQDHLGRLVAALVRTPPRTPMEAESAGLVLGQLQTLGAHVLGTDGKTLDVPLFGLIGWACSFPDRAEGLSLLHALLATVNLARPGPPLKGVLANSFFYTMTGLSGDVHVGSCGFNRFDERFPTLLDLLHDKGWRDPEFLRWATGMCPQVATVWEADRLEGVFSPSAQKAPSSPRL